MADAAGWSDWLARLQAEGKLPTAGQTLEAMRSALRAGLEHLEDVGPAIAEARAVTLPGPAGPIAARLYTPLAAGIAPAAGLVFFHGGGFALCDLDTHDRFCRRLAAASHVRILSIGYRLAPAHKFPAALDDALAAFDWATGEGAAGLGFDPARVGVGGDSAGGNLSAGVAQARRRPGTPERPAAAFQLLIYPLLQLAEMGAGRHRVLEGHLFSEAIFDGVRTNYLSPEDDPLDPRASPLFAPDLEGVCPAFIVTAGLDPLQHEARAYADRLAAAGVRVSSVHFGGAPHGFLQMTAVLDDAYEAFEVAGAALAKGLAGP
jgi:acetyl esterase